VTVLPKQWGLIDMKAMLLAAGRGERLRPLTDATPKCMLRFEGKPLLEHWIDKLHSVGIRDVVINVHHLAEVVVDHFGSGERWDMHDRGLRTRVSLLSMPIIRARAGCMI
jgi:NDP-sugar pyrophosphorylase family protein